MSMYTILLGKGLGDFWFGSTEEEALEYFGMPDDIDEFEYEGGEWTKVWKYDDQSISFSFDSEDNFRLSDIEISNPNCELFGYKLIDKTKQEVLDILQKFDLGSWECGDMSEDIPDCENVSYDEKSLNLWFKNGELEYIQFGYLTTDEKKPQWPI
ncbi:MAG: hypothetical protein GY938_16480 [Ketobacter sp.]|nr:hypothetical protein [Ketobacter sp.]